MEEFGKIREAALKYWFEQTKRDPNHEDFSFETYEDIWARKYTSEGMHNSLFCSMKEWNSHITDLLSDSSLDKFKFKFEDEEKSEVFFRYYTRFLLIISEVISDFSKMLELIVGGKQEMNRKLLSSSELEFDVKQLIGYINNICKHKIEKSSDKALHNRNHHCQKVFADSPGYKRSNKAVHVGDFIKAGIVKALIESPKLKDLIDQVMNCYIVVDKKMEALNKSNRKSLLSKFEEFEMPVEEAC